MSEVKKKKVFQGTVTSDKMDKTIVVKVSTKKLHPIYKKYVNWSKKYKAHDAENKAATGDKVRIIESRPLSKDKAWRLVEILEKAR